MRTWFVVALIALAQVARAQEDAVSLTLRECIERALENNLDISIERINPKIESANVFGDYGDFDPHLQLNVSRTHSELPLFVVQTNNAATETRSTFFSP